MIKLIDVTKTYKIKKYKKTALNNVNLEFKDSGFYCISGKSGSGKTTLLNMIAGLDTPSLGQIIVDDKDLSKFSENQLNNYRGGHLGMIFQSFNLIDEYTVYENISLSLKIVGEKDAVIDAKTDDILTRLDLHNIAFKYPNKLSGGEKQRVAIARALIKNPKILLVDEPTGNLDKENAKNIMNMLKEISKDKLVIMVSHNDKEVKKYGDCIIEMIDGVISKITDNSKDVLDDDVEDITVKKAKLSFKRIINLSFSNIKRRKIKFVVMLLLLSISFGILGVSYNFLLYDKGEAAYKTFTDNNISQVNFIKQQNICESVGLLETCWTEYDSITRDEVKELNEKYQRTNINYFRPVDLYITSESDFDENKPYYNNQLSGIVYVNDFDAIDYELIGRKPQNSNEIIITEYMAEMLAKFYYPDLQDNIEALSNKYLFPIDGGGYHVEIVGIYKDNHTKFLELKNYDKKSSFYNQLLNSFTVARKTMYSIIYVHPDLNFGELVSDFMPESQVSLLKSTYAREFKIGSLNWSDSYKDHLMGNSNSELLEDEIILGVYELAEIFRVNSQNLIDDPSKINDYLGQYIDFTYEFGGFEKESKTLSLKIVGVVDYAGIVYLHNNYYENLYDLTVSSMLSEKMSMMIELTGDKESIINLLNSIEKDGYTHNTDYSDAINNYSQMFNSADKLIVIVAIIFVIFSLLLVYSMIKSTILDRQKDIGIFRSLGVSKIGIGKMFLLQSAFISIITALLSSLIVIGFTNLVNQVFGSDYSGTFTVITTSNIGIILLVVSNIVCVNLFCLLAMLKYLFRPPIEAINE